MKTHKQSFEELRAVTSNGNPFVLDGEFVCKTAPVVHNKKDKRGCWYASHTTLEPDGIPIAKVIAIADKRKANSEAVIRLLNAFVAGDGLAILGDALECMKQLDQSATHNGLANCARIKALRALIAQLDGEGK